MEHFVTLFDSLFLPQGLALHQSMERHVRQYVLWILCIDDETHSVLEQLSLPNVQLLKLSVLETDELLSVKSGRSIAEYCWTLTPFAPRFVFKSAPAVKRVTYLDADLWFLKHPQRIFDEFDASGKCVLITDHAYAPEYDHSARSGQFCVQFMTFQRDGGEVVRQWWEERCIEWCFARFEDGRYGDQKYLDDWPERFGPLVHVLQDKELALAPWSSVRFPYANAVFYHFHGLRILSRKKLLIGRYLLPLVLKRYVYRPYCNDLKAAINRLEAIQYTWKPQAKIASLPRRICLQLKHLCLQFKLFSQSGIMKW